MLNFYVAQLATTPDLDMVIEDQTGNLMNSIRNIVMGWWWAFLLLVALSIVISRMGRHKES